MKRTLIALILALTLLTAPALAYTGDTFSIDIPDDYSAVPAGELYLWQREDGCNININVVPYEADAAIPNPYDFTQRDADLYAGSLLAEYERMLEEEVNSGGFDAQVSLRSASFGDVGAYRCLIADLDIELKGEGITIAECQRSVFVFTKERGYAMTYTALGESLPAEAEEILASFRTTDEVYGAKTGFFDKVIGFFADGGLMAGILEGAAVGGIVGLIWWAVASRAKRKREAVPAPEKSLPDFGEEK